MISHTSYIMLTQSRLAVVRLVPSVQTYKCIHNGHRYTIAFNDYRHAMKVSERLIADHPAQLVMPVYVQGYRPSPSPYSVGNSGFASNTGVSTVQQLNGLVRISCTDAPRGFPTASHWLETVTTSDALDAWSHLMILSEEVRDDAEALLFKGYAVHKP